MNIKKLLKELKLNEHGISTFLGIVIVIIIGVLLINYFSKNKSESQAPIEIGNESTSFDKHTVAKGEDLWNISEKYYGSGYNWTDIAKENNIENPNQITEGQVLTIPDVENITITPTVSQNIIPTIKVVGKQSEFNNKTTYTVEKDDSLWKISQKLYGSGYNWTDIAKANNLTNPGIIVAGQQLNIPNVEPKLITGISQVKPTISDSNYTVEKGDSLWVIAVRAYGDGYKWSEIAKDNNLSNPNIIEVGQILSIKR